MFPKIPLVDIKEPWGGFSEVYAHVFKVGLIARPLFRESYTGISEQLRTGFVFKMLATEYIEFSLYNVRVGSV